MTRKKFGGSAEIRTQNNWVRASYDTPFHHKPITKIWRSQGDSNPCIHRERVVSLPLDDGNKITIWKHTIETAPCHSWHAYHFWLPLNRRIGFHWTIVCFNMVPSERLELPTYWLQISCTTSCAMKAIIQYNFKEQELSRWTLYQPYNTYSILQGSKSKP